MTLPCRHLPHNLCGLHKALEESLNETFITVENDSFSEAKSHVERHEIFHFFRYDCSWEDCLILPSCLWASKDKSSETPKVCRYVSVVYSRDINSKVKTTTSHRLATIHRFSYLCWELLKVMEIDNVIFQDLESFGKEKFSKLAI